MRVLSLLLLSVIAVVVVVLSIANRHLVPVSLAPDLSAYGLPTVPDREFPLYAVALVCGVFGFLAGAVLEFLREGVHRRAARERKRQVAALREELDAVRATSLKDEDEDLLLLASR
jgi:hypothetical protein